MTKIKVMMTVITVLAVVGGALAFKARTYEGLFRTRKLADGAGSCQGWYSGAIAPFNQKADFYFTAPTINPQFCTAANCANPTRLTNIED